MIDPFDQLDTQALTRIPLTDTSGLLALTEALRRLTPVVKNEALTDAVEFLDDTEAEVRAVLVAHHDTDDAPAYGTPQIFDGGLDALWVTQRNMLQAWSGFLHPGLDPFIEAGGPIAASLATNRERARRAARLHEQLFRGEGVRFTNLSYPQQSKIMGTILEVIAKHELGPQLDELGAEGLAGTLDHLQGHYRGMVADRLTPDERLEQLGRLRLRLHRALSEYALQVAALISRKRPETLELVVSALGPITALREQLARARRVGPSAGEVSEAQVEAEAPVEAEAEAETEAPPSNESEDPGEVSDDSSD